MAPCMCYLENVDRHSASHFPRFCLLRISSLEQTKQDWPESICDMFLPLKDVLQGLQLKFCLLLLSDVNGTDNHCGSQAVNWILPKGE